MSSAQFIMVHSWISIAGDLVVRLCGKHSAGSSFNVLAVFATRTLTAPLQVGLLLSLQGATYMGSLTDRLLEECGFWSGGAATRADVVPCMRQGLLDSPAIVDISASRGPCSVPRSAQALGA